MVKSRPGRGRPHVRPGLKAGEYAILIHVAVPDMAFTPRPISEAKLEVSVQKLVAPPVEVTQLEPPPEAPAAPPKVPLSEDPDYKAGFKAG